MKITAIKTLVCHARMRNWVFVKVLTDQDGLWGWGEATLEWHTRSVIGPLFDALKNALASRLLAIARPTLGHAGHHGHSWRG